MSIFKKIFLALFPNYDYDPRPIAKVYYVDFRNKKLVDKRVA